MAGHLGHPGHHEFAFREGNAKASEKLQAWMLEKGIDELDASDFFDFLSDEYSLKLRKQDEQAGDWVG